MHCDVSAALKIWYKNLLWTLNHLIFLAYNWEFFSMMITNLSTRYTLIFVEQTKIRFMQRATAIYTLMSLKKSEYTDSCLDLLRKVSFNIRVRRIQGLISIIYLMHNLIYSDLLPDDVTILDNMLFGLDYGCLQCLRRKGLTEIIIIHDSEQFNWQIVS